MPFIRSISGIRATVSDSLPAEVVVQYVTAFARFLPDGEIVVGRDGRPSGEAIERLIAETLSSCNRNVTLLGIVPTPTIQLLTEHSANVAGGISITASHNPAEWNGMKFIFSDGIFLDAEQNNEMWEIADSLDSTDLPIVNGTITINTTANEQHIHNILGLPIFTESSLFSLRNRKLKVVVDAVNASGSIIVPQLLECLGCTVIPLFCNETGIFPHTPEPLPENLSDLSDAVKFYKADIGIAVDPDADRLVLIDENGLAIGEEKTIVLAALSVFENIQLFNEYSRDIAVNLSTSRMINDIANRYLATVWRCAVGEVNVVRTMQDRRCVIGGEGSGGVILPVSHYGRDSLVGIALVLHLLSSQNATLSQISNTIPPYEMLKTKREFKGNFIELAEKLKVKFSNATLSDSDGIRFDFADSWVHIRSSNTEPIVRIIAEAATKQLAEELINEAGEFF